MQILNGGVDEGKASFAQAQALDATIDLDPSYKNPMLDGIWSEVKKGEGPAPASAGATSGSVGEMVLLANASSEARYET